MITKIEKCRLIGMSVEHAASYMLEEYKGDALSNIVDTAFNCFINSNNKTQAKYALSVHSELRLTLLASGMFR